MEHRASPRRDDIRGKDLKRAEAKYAALRKGGACRVDVVTFARVVR